MSTIRSLAELLAGVQVTLSIPGRILGAADAPVRELRQRLKLNGWVTADEVEAALRKVIQDVPR